MAIKKALPSTLPDLPHIDDTTMPITVTYFENPSKFWVQLNDNATFEKLNEIEYFLNHSKHIKLNSDNFLPSIGSVVATEWKDKKLYRAIVESYCKIKNYDVANVLLIDLGYRQCQKVTDLRIIEGSHKIINSHAVALECRLSEIEPSKTYTDEGTWSKKASDLFNNYLNDSYQLFGVIYSVVDSIVALRLMCTSKSDSKNSVNLNDLLIKQGLAVALEENYLSKYNHKLRKKTIKYNATYKDYLKYLQYEKNYLIKTYPEPPNPKDCRSIMALKGPYSPLEMSLSSLAISSSGLKINIHSMSVNSILLDSNPENPSECLLVASNVKQSQSGSYLTLNNTTLMPNIDGLTAMICLIFAPKIELRRSANGSHYIGALCGLGCNETNTALLPEHDLEVYFDVEIDNNDMLNVIIYIIHYYVYFIRNY
jgi:ATP-dependent RNA helicase TDRD9